MNKPDSLVRDASVVLGVVTAFAGVVGGLYVARNLLMLVFGAILIAVVINRVAQLLGSWLPKAVSRRHRVAIVVGLATVVAAAGIYGFANAASEQAIQLADRMDQATETVIKAAKQQPLVQRFMAAETSMVSTIASSTKSLGFAQNLFATAFGGITDCLILVILSAYFCVSPQIYRAGAIRLVAIPWRDRMSNLLSESSDTLWRWMLGRLLAMMLVGILFGFGLALLGIPMPVELGLFAALVTFVPNIGGIAAVIPALLLAASQGTSTFLGVLVLYLCIQFAESYLLTPLVQQQQVSLPPAIVILAQVVAGLIFGFWGVAFATPLVAIAVLWVKRLYVEGWLEAPHPT